MRTLLLSICFGLLSLNAYSQSKLVGAGKATKVGGSAASKTATTKRPAKTSTPVKKTPLQTPAVKQDPNAKYASSGYMEISGVSFANVDTDGHIIDDYGSNLYASEVKYLKPKVFYRGLASVEKEISIPLRGSASILSSLYSATGFRRIYKIRSSSLSIRRYTQ